MNKNHATILYVDDIHFNLVSVKDRLKYHYNVFTAQSVKAMFEQLEQLKMLIKGNPDLILLDLNMPEVDGFGAIWELKNDSRYSSIPVMFLSSKNDMVTVKTAMDLGAADYVTKPFSDTELIDCIEYQLDPDNHNTNSPIILAVDDDPSILKSIKHLFDGLYRVYLLQDPHRIKDILKRLTPDLFLLDCLMTKINGFDLVSIIREFAEHKETPIIFLTSENTPDNISSTECLGASDFIVKPIDEKVLHKKAATHLSGYRMRRRLHHALKL